MLNEAKTSRPRPELQGRGQSYEAEANFWRLRPRLRPKIIMKKYQIIITVITYDLRLLPEKLTKVPNFCLKNAQLHNKTTRLRLGRDQMFEAEAKASRLRPNL